MSGKKGRRNVPSSQRTEKTNNCTPKQQRKTAVKAILLVLLCVILLGIYFSVLKYEEKNRFTTSIITRVYAYADVLLVSAYAVLNLGFTNKKITPDMFSEEIDRETAFKRAEILNKNKAKAKWLLYLIIPLTFTVFADVIILFWGDTAEKLFSLIFTSFAG